MPTLAVFQLYHGMNKLCILNTYKTLRNKKIFVYKRIGLHVYDIKIGWIFFLSWKKIHSTHFDYFMVMYVSESIFSRNAL